MNPDEADEEAPNNRLERLPQSAEQANGQESLRTALAIARRVHRANLSNSPAINSESGEIWRLSEEIKLLEAQALSEWASQTSRLVDNVLVDADGDLLIFDRIGGPTGIYVSRLSGE